MKQKVLFIYNWLEDTKKTEEFYECATTDTVNRIKLALKFFNMEVVCINALNPQQLIEVIRKTLPVDLAFVIAEGFLELPSSLYDGTGVLMVRQILEKLNIPYTHSNIKTMEICRNKELSYNCLTNYSIRIPQFSVLNNYKDFVGLQKAEEIVGYPMFIKPVGGGNSIGIDENSLVHTRGEFKKKLLQLKDLIGDQSIITETYLGGQEYTVGVIGNSKPMVMPIIAFPKDFRVRSQKVKMNEYKERKKFDILTTDDEDCLEIINIALEVFNAVGARDVIRLDLKKDYWGNIYVIDINGTPSLSITSSLTYMAESMGVTHTQLIGYILFVTLTRYSLPVSELLYENAKHFITMWEKAFDNQVA